MNLTELLQRWNSDEGKPYKGSLIDWDAWKETGQVCAMCAQGQALHMLGGWDARRLKEVTQRTADLETAKLFNISVAHSILLRNVNDKADGAPSIVLTDPSKVLGQEWSKLLDFWWHLDQMAPEQWAAARHAAGDAARDAARDAAGDAARDAAWAAARAAARAAAGDAAWAAARAAAGYAASEIQGAHLLRERGKGFHFLPMFGFADPEAIPSRPANYGTQA